ncbi:MAG: Asp23/Gls24 family envelope stress response protein [Anaerolineales bacterium]|nr:Asp23/Gls24 family envelope stress response protein [Anaerolineales bacterium]
MATTERPPGKTTIAPGVLSTIIRLTALQVEGVSRLAQVPSSVNSIFSRNRDDGVEITVEDDGSVYADLHLILTDKANIRETSKQVQDKVSEAISKMVGLEVGTINVHIEDIDYQNNPATED